MKGWHAGRVLFALARHFDWWQNQIITEFEIGGCREDVVIVSRSGYATVIEIKISRADWIADKHKGRNAESRERARFFYAVPSCLYAKGVPEHVPAHAGILVVSDGGLGYDFVREMRAAKRFKCRPLKAEKLDALQRTFYFRFWRQQMGLMGSRIDREKKLLGRPLDTIILDDLPA